MFTKNDRMVEINFVSGHGDLVKPIMMNSRCVYVICAAFEFLMLTIKSYARSFCGKCYSVPWGINMIEQLD